MLSKIVEKLKKHIFLITSFAVLGLIYPRPASAGWVQWLATTIPVEIAAYLLKIFLKIGVFFTGLAGSLVNWVLSPDFISMSYTKPGIPPNPPDGNEIIKIGLGVTQGFANMILVLILVYIALATILHIKEHEAQKLLPKFIIIALLVNFTPVFCGLIVDASNVVMNFFVKDLKADAFGSHMSGKVDQLYSSYKDANQETALKYLSQMAVMLPFLGILGFILLIFFFIFLFRYIAIWMLVILSPLAFISLVLPTTKKYWTMWWSQFIHWSFVGATAGFFLYLGLYLSSMTSSGTVSFSNISTEAGPLFDQIIPYFASAAFLLAGMILGLKTSAIGASAVIGFAQRSTKAGSKAMTKRGLKLTRGTVKKGWDTVKDRTQKTAMRIGRSYRMARQKNLKGLAAGQEVVRREWHRMRRKTKVKTEKTRRKIQEEGPGKAAAKTAAGITIKTVKLTTAASKGVLSAVKDTAAAAAYAGFKLKKKKKGRQKCPACGNTNVAKSAKSCPFCGYSFE